MNENLKDVLWPDTPFPLKDCLVLVGRRGSEAHGLFVPSTDPNSIDDRDLAGVCILPVEYYFGLSAWDHAEAIKDCWDVVLDEYTRFVRLALKQNPNVLSLLWLEPEDYLYVTPAGQSLINNRAMLRSKHHAFNAFCGYADQQIKLMETREAKAYKGYMGEKRKKIVDAFGYDVKNACHAIRLLRMGCEYLETGELNVRRKNDREELLAIKTGRWKLEAVREEAKKLFLRAHEAFIHSPLPEYADRDGIEEILVAHLRDWRGK